MSPAEINWLIFSPVWTLAAVALLTVLPWKLPHVAEKQIPKLGLFVLEALTMVHWLAGFLALAVFLSDRICFGTVCQVAKAGTAISAFQWITWVGTLISSGIRIFRNRGQTAPKLRGGEPKVEMHQGV